MNYVEFCWIDSHDTFKGALQELLGCSGQLLKKNFSSKELQFSVKPRSISRISLDVVNNKRVNPIYEGPPARVIAVRDDYIIVHKPANLHSHPHDYSDKNTVLNFLSQENYNECIQVNVENYDRGLIYRLDFETSGIMIVAKNDNFYQKMRNNFSSEVKSKFYLAVVTGKFNQEGFHSHGLKASGEKGSKQKVVDRDAPNDGVGDLEVKLVAYENGKSLVLVNLHSGLRHQIRAQLSHLGFPILGDTLYGGTESTRLFLHAYRYEFGVTEEDTNADLFDSFFDLNSCFEMCHNMFGLFKRR